MFLSPVPHKALHPYEINLDKASVKNLFEKKYRNGLLAKNLVTVTP